MIRLNQQESELQMHLVEGTLDIEVPIEGVKECLKMK